MTSSWDEWTTGRVDRYGHSYAPSYSNGGGQKWFGETEMAGVRKWDSSFRQICCIATSPYLYRTSTGHEGYIESIGLDNKWHHNDIIMIPRQCGDIAKTSLWMSLEMSSSYPGGVFHRGLSWVFFILMVTCIFFCVKNSKVLSPWKMLTCLTMLPSLYIHVVEPQTWSL